MFIYTTDSAIIPGQICLGGFMKHVRFFDDRCRKGAFLTLIRQQRCHLHTWSISVLYFATRVMKSYTFVRMCII